MLRTLLRSGLGCDSPEVDSLLALMLLHDARREAGAAADGQVVLLEAQDRARWDRAQIAEGCALVQSALSRARPGSYALEAAIAAVHAESTSREDTDWPQIAALYQRLLALHPSPVVALNHAAAVAMAEGPARALPLVEALAEPLASYPLWHAARADLLRQLDRPRDAIQSYERARSLTQNESELRFLGGRIDELRARVR
jgi:RNA polymerase sigma-70 factor (ECF subfamily)